MKRYRLWDHDRCPHCGQSEDSAHLSRCAAEHVPALWDKALAALTLWMDQKHTAPALHSAILHFLESWRQPHQPSSIAHTDPLFRDVVEAQAAIGKEALYFGFISTHWAEVQQAYLTQLQRTQTGRQWVSALIRRLWEIAWDFWTDRNGYLHNLNQTRDNDLADQIRAQFTLGWDQLPVAAHHWFAVSPENLIRQPRHTRMAWIQHVHLVRQQSAREEADRNRRARQFMCRWLTLRVTPPMT